jgi:hypothetical protein
MRLRVRPAVAIVTSVLVVGALRLFPSCNTSGPPGLSGVMDGAVMSNSLCQHPYPGCGCSTIGEKASCGTVKSEVDGFIQCSMGTTTCDGSKWGTCEGDVIVDKTSITGGGIHTAALTGSPCGTVDPCDPYCQNANGDGGVTIPSTCTSPTDCDEAPGPFSALYGALAAASQADPTPCTSGAADNCQFDSSCIAGVCTPYTAGDYNTNAACTAAPDFTLGIGCCDATVAGGCNSVDANPNTMTMEVCNRGGLAATSGTLVIGINHGTPSAPGPSACADGAAGATWPTGPAILATAGSTAGWCDINLGTTPIGIGQCISFNIAASCTAMGGGALDNLTGNSWAVANVPATILTNGQANPLTECDTCNNFTALNSTSATGALAADFTCNSATVCGCSLSGSGTSTTIVNGTVYDPGVNVPLPNVNVYQASGALIALPDGVACDTCASVLSPFTFATVSSTTGAFSLPVTPTAGSANIVFQTGRWRREITVTGITSGTTNYIGTSAVASTTATAGACPCVGNCSAAQSAACQTRLPQTQDATDNIPLIALSTGNKEPFECDLAKFMGGTSEINIPSAGTRIQLFHDSGGESTAPDSEANLWHTQADLNKYTAIILPCSSTSGELATTLTAAEAGYFLTYAEAGGKLFVDHDSVLQMLQVNPPASAAFNGTSTWLGGGNSNTPNLTQGRVEGTTATHTAFVNWLTDVGAYAGGYLATPDPRERAVQANVAEPSGSAPGFEWLRGCEGCSSTTWTGTGDFSLTYSFTVGAAGIVPTGSASECGAVIYNGMHVDTARASGSWPGTFPGECSLTAPVSPNEMAFEYLIFALTGCAVGSTPPPPPPPPLPVTTVTSPAIEANCPVGTGVKWGFLEWQSTIPPGTSIGFTAQTAPDNGGTPGTWGPAVPAGTANATTAPATWGEDACTVDGHLEDLAVYPNEYGLNPACTGVAPPQLSQAWLQITFTLNPAGPISPTLVAWRQLYDCVPNQ